MECAEYKTRDEEQRESRQESEGATGDWPRTGWRMCSKQPEGRKQNVENGAQDICHAQSRRQRKRVYFP